MPRLLEIPHERAVPFIRERLSTAQWPLPPGLYALAREALNDPRQALSVAVAASLPLPPPGEASELKPYESVEEQLAKSMPGLYGAAKHYKKSFKVDAHMAAIAAEKEAQKNDLVHQWDMQINAVRASFPLWSMLFVHTHAAVRATATARIPLRDSPLTIMLPMMCSDPDPLTRQAARTAMGMKPKQNWKAYAADRLKVREAKAMAATVAPLEGQSMDDALHAYVIDFRPTVRAIAAFRLPPESVWWAVLSVDASASVRRSVAERIALTSPIAEKLLHDKAPAVRKAIAARRLAAYGREAPYKPAPAERKERPLPLGPTLKQMRRVAAKEEHDAPPGVENVDA